MKHRACFATALALLVGGCKEQGSVTFCMQWVNTSTYNVVFRAKDNTGREISTESMNSPGIGDAFAAPVEMLTGDKPITFSTDANFGAITISPTGGQQILLVEAGRTSSTLQYYEEPGQCPP